jgi:hypothetical protein
VSFAASAKQKHNYINRIRSLHTSNTTLQQTTADDYINKNGQNGHKNAGAIVTI